MGVNGEAWVYTCELRSRLGEDPPRRSPCLSCSLWLQPASAVPSLFQPPLSLPPLILPHSPPLHAHYPQAAGIRYIGFRNEQAAGYAAAAAGFLTGVPAVLLTVSGPGAVHGVAGLSHAAINCWPLIQVGG